MICAVILFCFSGYGARIAQAQTPVSIELVLAVDTSLSVSDIEYRLQMGGIAQAFRTPEIIDLIGRHDGVAVTLIQWAGWVNTEHAVPWRLLTTAPSILSFANEVDAAKRETVGYFTAIGTAIEAGLQALATNRYAGQHLKIDISGDGRSNAGPPPAQSRLLAQALGVTINGLAVLTDFANLDEYYRRQVISGPSAFVVRATDYEDFARAIRLKLLRELASAISRNKEGHPATRQAMRLELSLTAVPR